MALFKNIFKNQASDSASKTNRSNEIDKIFSDNKPSFDEVQSALDKTILSASG